MRRKKGAYSEYAIAAFARSAKYEGELTPPIKADLAAVAQTFAKLTDEHVSAVKAVYAPYRGSCRIPGHVLHGRIIAHSMDSYSSEASIYRALREARRVFAECRGMSID